LKTGYFGDMLSRRHPLIMVMETIHFRPLSDRPQIRWLNWSWLRCIHLQRSMRTPIVIVVHIGLKNTTQMSLIEYDDIVETLATDTADEPLNIRRLPRTTRRNFDFFDPHVTHALLERLSVNRIPVSQQVTWRCIPWKRVDHLLRGLLGGRVLGNVEMHDTPPVMDQDNEHEQDPESCRGHREKVARHQVGDMVIQERLPRG
jgi:hypothetical protein